MVAGNMGGLIGVNLGVCRKTVFGMCKLPVKRNSAGGLGTGKSTADMKNYLTFSVRGWLLKGLGNGNIWNMGNGRTMDIRISIGNIR